MWCRSGVLAVLLACVLGLLAGCTAPSGGDGVGGTGLRGGDGLGGTGALVRAGEDDGDGVGGTGIGAPDAGLAEAGDGVGGTGVVGPITALGSIVVNDLHIRLDALRSIEVNGTRVAPQGLAVGRIVQVLADRVPGGYQARELVVLDAAVGPLQRHDAARETLQVMGQRVSLAATTQLGGTLHRQQLTVGMRLRVSGHRDAGGTVRATRIERVAPDVADSVAGPVRRLADGRPAIGDLVLPGPLSPDVEQGRWLLARGQLRDGRLVASATRVLSSVPFADRARRLVVQGLSVPDRLGVTVAGVRIALEASTFARRGALRGRLVRAIAVRQPGGAMRLQQVLPRDGGVMPFQIAPPIPAPQPVPLPDAERRTRALDIDRVLRRRRSPVRVPVPSDAPVVAPAPSSLPRR